MLADLLRNHDGVITLGQANAAGLGRDDVRYRVRTGQWIRCGRAVYFAHDREFTDRARVRAGVWVYGECAVATGLTAAWWHGLTQFAPKVVEVTVARDRRLRVHLGTKLRRRDLDPCEIVVRDHLRVTALPLTVVEARRGGGVRLMDSALQRHVDLPALWKAHLNNKGHRLRADCCVPPRTEHDLRLNDCSRNSYAEPASRAGRPTTGSPATRSTMRSPM